MELEIIRYDEDFKDDLIEFLGLHWTSLESSKIKKEYFEWKYKNNPYSNEPLCYLALDGQKIVGHRGFYIQKFKHNEKTFPFVIPANAFVHPDYRRKGIFSRLIKYSQRNFATETDIKLILSLTPNKASTKATLKYDYEPIGNRERIYIFSFFNMLKILKSNRNFDEHILVNEGDLEVKITDELRPKEISGFMEECRCENKITNIRDDSFYRWRFSHPLRKYFFVYCTKNGELIGYLILQKNSEKFYKFMEHAYKEPVYFKEMIKTVQRKLDIPIISQYLFTRPKDEKSLFSEIGFHDKNDFFMKILRQMNIIQKRDLPGALIKPISENGNDEDFILNSKDLRDPSNWSLFESDLLYY